MIKQTRWVMIMLLVLLALPAMAQETTTENEPQVLPASVMLEGFQWVHQGVNRCSAAALTIHLSFFEEISLETYNTFARQELNTWADDASVRIEEMAQSIRDVGYGAIVRRGGTVDLLKALLAAGFPVLVENSYYESNDLYRDWLSHNRVLIGYDDAQNSFFFQDPLLGFPSGDLVSFEYDNFDNRWRPFTRDYLVIYDLEDESIVQGVLGDDWDATRNAENVLAVSQAEIDDGRTDGYAYYNLGWAQLQLGMFEDAAASFDLAREAGLPLRFMWYEFGVFEAYLAVGRYQEVIDLVNVQLVNAGDAISVEEWFYYAGRAYEALGNTQRAMSNYQLAVTRNNNYSQAAEALAALQSP